MESRSPTSTRERGSLPASRALVVTGRAALILPEPSEEPVTTERRIEDLVAVTEFRDPIYPGLRPSGAVEAGGDRPYHVVINGENYHVLEALTFTCAGVVDCIYIDPPYNSRDKQWKYNNDYVDSDDDYRHSKWLAMMERRLKVAKDLLTPDDPALIVTIDEREVLRLGLLLGASDRKEGRRLQSVRGLRVLLSMLQHEAAAGACRHQLRPVARDID